MSSPDTAEREVQRRLSGNGQRSSLATKLVAARLAVEPVDKGGRNEAQKYDYVRAEDIARAAEKALLAQGLLADLDVVSSSETPIKSRNGSDGLIVKAECRLIVNDPESKDSIERGVIGYGSDFPGDKAIYKAMTGARKYALIHLLGIDIGDDPDEDRRGQPSSTDAKPEGVGKDIAKKLVDRVWAIKGAKEKLQLAASTVAEKDVGDCSTKPKATAALSGLTYEQAERLSRRLDEKEHEQQQEAADD